MAHPGLSSRPRLRRAAAAAALVAALAAALLVVAAASGCSTGRGVPAGAKLVTEATVKSAFTAPADGMIYLYRVPARGSRGQLHYSGPIGAGQVLVIDPAMNKATIDGRELELVLPGGDVWYQAYFREDRSVRRVLEERPAGASPGTSDTNVIDVDTGRPLDVGDGQRDPGTETDANSPQ